MRTPRRRTAIIVLLVLWAALLSGRSEASYLDAGSGSYLFQIALAVVLTGAYFVKSCLRNVAARLSDLLGLPKRR